MLKFCCNINWLFHELDFADRFAAASDAGFQAVEFHHPEGCEPASIVDRAKSAGVEIALFNAWPGDLLEGGSGLSGVPGRDDQFAQAVYQAAALGGAIGGALVQIGPSQIPAGVSRADCLEAFATNMHFATQELAKVRCRVMIEPMNRVEFPDILIADAAAAIEQIDRIGAKNLGLQFDCYHEAMNGGDVMATIRRVHHRIDHLQFSDAPGRGEPGSGNLDIPSILSALEQLSYAGWVSAEYRPTGSSEDSLTWLHSYRHT